MKLKDLVPTKETCQELKELGFPQDTFIKWTSANTLVTGRDVSINYFNHVIAAPTFVEVWKQLPEWYEPDELSYRGWLVIDKVDSIIGYRREEFGEERWYYATSLLDNLAEAAARLWINLKNREKAVSLNHD